jgi:hypothetical protein
VTYDPDLESLEIKRSIRKVGIDDELSTVSGLTALGGRRSMSRLPKSKMHPSALTLSTLNNGGSQYLNPT